MRPSRANHVPRGPLLLFSLLLTVPRVFATPSVGTPVAAPSYLTVGQAVTVTVTCQITVHPGDPPISAGGVSLFRVDANGQMVANLGVMHDDGTGGDAVAGDSIYTTRFGAHESQGGT